MSLININDHIYFFMMDWFDGYFPIEPEIVQPTLIKKKAAPDLLEKITKRSVAKKGFIKQVINTIRGWDYYLFSNLLESMMQEEYNCYSSILLNEETLDCFEIKDTKQQGYYSKDLLPELLFVRFESVFNAKMGVNKEMERRQPIQSLEQFWFLAIKEIAFEPTKFLKLYARAQKTMKANAVILKKWEAIKENKPFDDYTNSQFLLDLERTQKGEKQKEERKAKPLKTTELYGTGSL